MDSYGACLHNKDFEGDSAHKPWGISFGEMMAIKIETLRKYKFFLVSLLYLIDCYDDHYLTKKKTGL